MNLEVRHWLIKSRAWLVRGRGELAALSMGRAFSAVCALGVAIASARQLGPTARGEIVLVMAIAVISTEIMCLGADVTGRIQILRSSTYIFENRTFHQCLLNQISQFGMGAHQRVSQPQWPVYLSTSTY